MLGERKLRYEPKKVAQLVKCCAILHNILIKNNVVLDDDVVEAVDDVHNNENPTDLNRNRQEREEALSMRRLTAEYIWRRTTRDRESRRN